MGSGTDSDRSNAERDKKYPIIILPHFAIRINKKGGLFLISFIACNRVSFFRDMMVARKEKDHTECSVRMLRPLFFR